MNTCSGPLRSVQTLIAVFVVTLCPILARASMLSPDSAEVTPAGPAAVDAVSAPTPSRNALSPGAALGVGLAGTAVPLMLAYGLTTKDSRAEDIALFAGVTAGIVAGPALGLWSGGRGDLAKKGLIRRSIGAAICLGSFGAASAIFQDSGDSVTDASVLFGILGTAGGLLASFSALHDLAITPSATSQGRRMSGELGLRPDGKVALSVRF